MRLIEQLCVVYHRDNNRRRDYQFDYKTNIPNHELRNKARMTLPGRLYIQSNQSINYEPIGLILMEKSATSRLCLSEQVHVEMKISRRG